MTPAEIKRYHKWVSGLPCAHCGVSGETQVAHYHGKRKGQYGGGMGKKSHHLAVMPLCVGCHRDCDSGKWQTGPDPKWAESELIQHYIIKTLITAYDEGVIRIYGSL